MTKTLNFVQLAALLGVSRMTVHRMRKARELPPTLQTNRRFVRWLASDINLWLNSDCPREVEFKALKRTKQMFSGARR